MEAFIFFTQVIGLTRLGITHNNLNFRDKDVLTFHGTSLCFLVYDEIEESTLKEQLFASLNTLTELRKIYYVKHGQPSNVITNVLEIFCKQKDIELLPNIDQHEPATSKYYKLLKQLDFANLSISDDTVNILKKELGGDPILEAQLELLHNCLLPETIPSEVDPLLANYASDFIIFKASIKEKEFSDKGYLEALMTFRDKLLPS